jgi:peptide/nickel transport system substrate-binding protein
MRIPTGMALLATLVLALSLLGPGPAPAQTALVDGVGSEPRTADPYFHAEEPTNALNWNLYDGLTRFDADYKLQPALAEKWEAVNDTTWLFRLAKGVKFHDGTPFTAEDVKFSIQRCGTWARSGYKDSVAQIERVEVVDPLTVKLITKGPFGILPAMMARVMIMSKAHVEKTGDDAQATKPVGTGAYKLKEWIRGDHLTLTANEDYFRGAPKLQQIIIRPLTNDATRTAALLSGEVHIINDVPVRDVARLKADVKLDIAIRDSVRAIFLQMDQSREKSPKVESPTGKNPFLDVRVRRAVYLAINEEAIVKHVMNGFATAAPQMYPSSIFGYDESIKRPAYDPEKAKALLKEAGYPNGFAVTLDAPNDRYVNDDQIAQAVAADLARVGIKVKVNAIPKNTFFPLLDRFDSSFSLIGWGNNPPDAIRFLDTNTHTIDKTKGLGRYNYGMYSNPKVDKLIQDSSRTLKQEERAKLMKEAQRIALVEDQAYIPLHFQVNIHAKTKKLKWVPRADNYHIYHDMELGQ